MVGWRRAAILASLTGAGCVGLAVTNDHQMPGGIASAALAAVGGYAFVGAGAFAGRRDADGVVGTLLIAVGLCLFLVTLISSSVPFFFTVGEIGRFLYVALLVHLLLAFPTGRLTGSWDRGLVLAAYVAAIVPQSVRYLFVGQETLRAHGCMPCPTPVTLVVARPDIAAGLQSVQRVSGLFIGVTVAGVVLVRWWRGSRIARRRLAPLLWCGLVLAVMFAVMSALGLLGLTGGQIAVSWMYVSALTLLPLAFLGGLLRGRLEDAGAVDRLIERLHRHPSPRQLRPALANALGDPSLRLAFDSEDGYVDAEGRAVILPAADARQAVTPIEIDGRRVGAIVHDAAIEPRGLGAAVGHAAALWLDRERLDAELRATIAALRGSRERLVHAGDAERRRIERDLHDGAQQRLASLLLSLKLERRRLGPGDSELLDAVETGLAGAIGELRDLAAGILPPVLADRGLSAAVQELVTRSPVPVDVARMPSERMSPDVEIAAYFVISEALANVFKHAGAHHATVQVDRGDGRAVVQITDDGVGGAVLRPGSGLRGLSDRVGALDGKLRVESPPGGGTRLRVEIPCAP